MLVNIMDCTMAPAVKESRRVGFSKNAIYYYTRTGSSIKQPTQN